MTCTSFTARRRRCSKAATFSPLLEKLQCEGKICYFGVSCETTADALTCLRYPSISSLQLRLSLFDQSALETAVPRAHERGVALIARECFAGGLLAKPADALGLETLIPGVTEREAKRSEVLGYAGLAEQFGRSLPEFAFQFVHAVEGVSVTLLGMRTEAQVAGNTRLLAATPLAHADLMALRMQVAESEAASSGESSL